MWRFRLSDGLAVVAACDAGLAAIRSGSNLWRDAIGAVCLGLLCTGLIGAVVGRGRDAWWLGFAVFGWAYLLASMIPGAREVGGFPFREPASMAFDALHESPPDPNANPTQTVFAASRTSNIAGVTRAGSGTG